MIRLSLRQRGFTLIEVLVALAIIATALFALSRVVGQTVNHTSYLDEKVIASWVAQNLIADIELYPDRVEPGTSKGTAEMAGREWPWERRVEATEDPDLKRVEISVSSEKYRKISPLVTMVTLAAIRTDTSNALQNLFNRDEDEGS